MSETLIGVVIGGLIGSVTPIAQLFYSHWHWKREARLLYLKEQRKDFEGRIEIVLAELSKNLSQNSVSSKLGSELIVMMPEDALKLFDNYVCARDWTDEKKRALHLNISIALKKSLAEIDNEIRSLLL